MKKIVFIITVLCLTIITTTHAQGTKIATLDIHTLLTATPFGAEYKKMLENDYIQINSYEDLMTDVEGFKIRYEDLIINAYKAIDPNIGMVFILREAKIDKRESQFQAKVVYVENGVILYNYGIPGYVNEQLDITDQVSTKLLALMQN